MDAYSPLLALSMASLAAAIVAMVVGARAAKRQDAAWRASILLAGLAIPLVLVATIWHIAAGHSPGSDTAMGPVAFALEHPAILVVVASALLALYVSRGRLDGA